MVLTLRPSSDVFFYNFIIVHKLIFFTTTTVRPHGACHDLQMSRLQVYTHGRHCKIAVGNAICNCGPQPQDNSKSSWCGKGLRMNGDERLAMSSSFRVLIPLSHAPHCLLVLSNGWLGGLKSAATKQFTNNERNIVAVAMWMAR